MTQTLAEWVRKSAKVSRDTFLGELDCPVLVEIDFNPDAITAHRREGFHTDHVNARQILSRMLTVEGREVLLVKKRAEAVFSGHISVGRTLNLDVCIARTGMSKFHAHFSSAGDGTFLLTDKESKNGTFINGRRIAPGEPTPVAIDAEVRFATYAFRFMSPPRFHELLLSMRV